MVSDKKIVFIFFPILVNVKYVTPKGRVIFGPRGIIHKAMLHTKYHGSSPNSFRQEDFFMFLLLKAYVKPVTPEAGPFLAPDILFE